ncbi:TonB-dependent receptor [Sphingobium chlorophenolicum L-1]|uniref:TonB-dependent receptor n=1 Tax=Sphingobium chlorophenolicum L-1 TaxID=690566 RepID=F6F1M2_SPHCR|nr:TonB-dependent receptor [Sphingobium chlorophenolicum]AEG51438.1 TonB-dependent receptor [Sphingobium chlorophenolicum L-1]
MNRLIGSLGAGMAALAFAQAGAAHAAEMADAAQSETRGGARTEGSAEGSGEIIVTAQKKSESIREVPATILVKDSDQLINAGIRSPTDLGNAFPGLVFTRLATSAQPAIRGITSTAVSSTGGIEQPVAIYIDGIYSASQSNNLAFDPTMVSRIEVLKGPQGTVFGRNAVGGAILVYSRDPDLKELKVDGSVTLSRFGGGTSTAVTNNEQRLFVSAPLVNDRLGFAFSGVRTFNEGYLTNISPGANGSRYGRSLTENLAAKLLWEPNAFVRVSLSGRYSHIDIDSVSTIQNRASRALQTDGNGALVYPDTVIGEKPWQVAFDVPGPNKLKSYALTLRADFDSDIGKFTSLTGYQRIMPYGRGDAEGSWSPTCLAQRRCQDLRWYYRQPLFLSQEFNYASRDFGPFSFIAGVYGLHIVNETEANLWGDTFLALSRAKTDSFAVYGEGTLKLTDNFSVLAGIRYSFDRQSLQGTNIQNAPFTPSNEKSWSAATSRLGIKWAVTDSLNFYSTFSQGYKSGLLSYSSFNQVVNGVVVPRAPGAPVDPEHLDAYEAGFKYADRGLALNLSGFYYQYRDLQVQSYSNNLIVTSNAAKASIYGLDFDGSVKIAPQLRISGGGSWLPRARYDSYAAAQTFPLINGQPVSTNADASGRRLIRSPKWILSAGLDYSPEIAGGQADFNISYNYSSSYHHDVMGYMQQDKYGVWNASAAFTPQGSNVRATLFVRNLTNSAYAAGAAVNDNGQGVAFAPPREVGLTLGFKY